MNTLQATEFSRIMYFGSHPTHPRGSHHRAIPSIYLGIRDHVDSGLLRLQKLNLQQLTWRIVGFDLLFDEMSLLKLGVYMRNGWLGCAVMPLMFALSACL